MFYNLCNDNQKEKKAKTKKAKTKKTNTQQKNPTQKWKKTTLIQFFTKKLYINSQPTLYTCIIYF